MLYQLSYESNIVYNISLNRFQKNNPTKIIPQYSKKMKQEVPQEKINQSWLEYLTTFIFRCHLDIDESMIPDIVM